jgi:hypothetical protein
MTRGSARRRGGRRRWAWSASGRSTQAGGAGERGLHPVRRGGDRGARDPGGDGEAKARGEGATVYKGRLVDIASIKQAEVIVRQAEMIAERTPEGWVEVTERGERIAFVPDEMTEARIRLRFTSDAGYAGTWEAVLSPDGTGTRIVATERAEVPSPLRRLVARLVFDPEAFAATYLRELKSESERALQ